MNGATTLGIGAALLMWVLLLNVGFVRSGAIIGGVVVGLIVWGTRRLGRRDPRRGLRPLVIALVASATGLLAALLVLDNQSGPCNVDDFTGCSSAGEIAVFAFLFLIPTTAALGLILAILLAARLFRSDHAGQR